MVAIDTNTGASSRLGHGALDMVARTLTSRRRLSTARPGATVDFDVTARLIAGALRPRRRLQDESRARRHERALAGDGDRTSGASPSGHPSGRARGHVSSKRRSPRRSDWACRCRIPSVRRVTVLGAGASEAAIISLGGIVTGGARRVGGNDVDAAIATSLRVQLGVVVAPDGGRDAQVLARPRPSVERRGSSKSCSRAPSTAAPRARSTSSAELVNAAAHDVLDDDDAHDPGVSRRHAAGPLPGRQCSRADPRRRSRQLQRLR